MKLSVEWCVIVLNDEGAVRVGTEESVTIIESVYGPLSRKDAQLVGQDFNEQWDGSPYRAIVRPLTWWQP